MNEQCGSLPATIGEAVKILLADLSLREKAVIVNMERADLMNLHFSIGMSMFIRRRFNLWVDNDEFIESCCLYSGKKQLNIIDIPPVIVEALWEKLQNDHALAGLR